MNKNCVILTTNENSDGVDQYINIKNKSFDLIVIDYVSSKGQSLCNNKDVTMLYESEGGYKFQNLKKLIESEDLLSKYDYFWFPDWDIEIADNLNEMFYLADKYSFLLSQPSLSHSSFISWPVTRHQPSSEARYSEFVEIMCPLFQTSFLKKVLNTFDLCYSGWGLDHIWAKILSNKTMGIIDKVVVTHSKQITSQNWILPNNKNAHQECVEILDNIDSIIKEYVN